MLEENTTDVVTPEPSSETQPPVVDVDKESGIENIRTYARSLRDDVNTYKPVAEFVTNSFGDVENAKVAHQIYSQFVDEQFSPDKFFETISSLSPKRAEAVLNTLGSAQADKVVQQKLAEMFGGEVSTDEVTLFKQWKETGYGLQNEEELPEAFKYDAQGNPLSEEQIEVFEKQFKALKEMGKKLEGNVSEREKAEKAKAEADRVAKVNQAIDEFDNGRLKILEPDLEKFGLKVLPTDTPEQAKEKSFLKEFILGGVVRLFASNPELMKDYSTALGHIQNGETLLARRYEPRIEKGVVDTLRSPAIIKMLSALVPQTPPEPRSEIPNLGGGQPQVKGEGKSIEELTKQLFATGKIK